MQAGMQTGRRAGKQADRYIHTSTTGTHFTQAALRMTVRTRRDSSARLLEFVLRGHEFRLRGLIGGPISPRTAASRTPA